MCKVLLRTVKNSLFEQQKDRQLESVIGISQNIESDINLMILMLDGLANSAIFSACGTLQ